MAKQPAVAWRDEMDGEVTWLPDVAQRWTEKYGHQITPLYAGPVPIPEELDKERK